jgi:hypothetical protein
MLNKSTQNLGKKKKTKKLLGVAFVQILLLVLSSFAFAFILGELNEVSAASSLGIPSGTDKIRDKSDLAPAAAAAAAKTSAASTATAASGKGFLGGILSSSLFQGLLTAAFVGGLVYFIADAAGADDVTTKSLAFSAGAGVFTYSLLANTLGFGGLISGIAGLGVGAVVFALLYKKEKKRVVQFQCMAWEAPLGGDDCGECNNDPLRLCSEYRCKSLGQACELVNKDTKEEKCIWQNPNDVNSPIITPWDGALTEGYQYSNHDTLPTSLGTKIVRGANSCVKPFTPLEFGIFTNEPARCKIDNVHTEKLEEMQFFFGENNLFRNNHTQKLNLPSPELVEEESLEIGAGQIYDFYVRCQDANGNENIQEYVFNFCVDDSPDTTPPIIVDTSIISGSPVAFGIGEIDFSVYVNEPSECKWSIQDKNYEDMETSMSCASSVTEINAELLYSCSTTLTGIKDREENKYYFRCKDQPSKPDNERNVNVQSFELSLMGTQELNIINVEPNGTITGSTDSVNVDLEIETSNGANEGEAICYFSGTGNEGSYVSMFETGSFKHKQTLSLTSADYEYFFRCVDAGGNSDEANTAFTVFVDRQPPMITRAYRELDALKLVTNEDAACVYSLNNCNYNFDEGIAMLYSNPSIMTSHYSEWQPNLAYYIKCRDEFGNEPSPNACSLVATATNIV